MNKNIAYFGLLQFLINPSIRESINIGSLLFFSDGKIKFKSDENLKRIKLIYPSHDFTDISYVVKCLKEKIILINQNSDKDLTEVLESESPLKVAKLLDNYIHRNILLREGSSLLFTEVSPIVINQSPEHTLESIYDLYMGQHEKHLELTV